MGRAVTDLRPAIAIVDAAIRGVPSAVALVRESAAVSPPSTWPLCCVYARLILAVHYGGPVVDAAPITLWHLQPEAGDPWGPVTAAVRSGVGELVEAPVPGRWHIAQSWVGTPMASSGHTWLWLDSGRLGTRYDSAAGRGPTILASSWTERLARNPGGIRVAALR